MPSLRSWINSAIDTGCVVASRLSEDEGREVLLVKRAQITLTSPLCRLMF